MKQALMLAVAAFLFGLTGGAGYSFMKHTRPSPPAHALADSLAAVTARGDSLASEGEPGVVPEASADLAEAGGATPPAADSAGGQAILAGAPADSAAGVDKPASITPGAEMEPKRLAKLFGQMQPREAARVMAQMSDPEIQMILTLLGDRQASGILGSLPPERAAAVSRLVFGSNERTYQ